MDILIFTMCSLIWSLFYTLNMKEDLHFIWILINTWLWWCLSLWLVLILYDIYHKENTMMWVALITWALWNKFTENIWKTILNRFINNKK